MISTSILTQHHQTARVMMRRLEALVGQCSGASDAYRIALQLARLCGHLRVHYALLDGKLYPAMIACGDPKAAAMGRRMRGSLGGTAVSVEAFMKRWSSSALIAGDLGRFREQVARLIASVESRAEREQTVLFPLADAMGATLRSAA